MQSSFTRFTLPSNNSHKSTTKIFTSFRINNNDDKGNNSWPNASDTHTQARVGI